MSEAGRRRADARVLLVSLACLGSAGFLGLHALATPGVLLDHRSVGFVIATPIGLIVAAGFAAASSINFDESSGAVVMRHQRMLRLGLSGLLVGWAVISLIPGSPLGHAIGSERGRRALVLFGFAAVALYAVAAGRYAQVLLRRPSRLLFAIAAAWMLLAEALIAIAVAPTWLVSWWEWHALITLAVLVVAWAVEAEYRRPSSTLGPFTNLYLEHTLGRVDSDYAAALDELVAARALGKATDAHADELGGALVSAVRSGSCFSVRARSIGSTGYSGRMCPQPLHASSQSILRPGPGVRSERSACCSPISRASRRSRALVTGGGDHDAQRVLGAHRAGGARAWTGLIERFSGDAIMVMFNATGEQPDHALRSPCGARAAAPAQHHLGTASRLAALPRRGQHGALRWWATSERQISAASPRSARRRTTPHASEAAAAPGRS